MQHTLTLIFSFFLVLLTTRQCRLVIAQSTMTSITLMTVAIVGFLQLQCCSAWTTNLSPTTARLPSRLGAEKIDLDGNDASSRRSFLQTASVIVASSIITNSGFANADSGDDELINVYFGCGCFWHVQHEFVEAEKKTLGRRPDEATSRAGYAGGKAGALDGKVCYHNAQGIADYGKLGHAEVVSMRIPASKFELFAEEYCKLFDKDGFRPDQFGDRGSEYRNLVGVPGGKNSAYAEMLVKASVATGDKLDFAVGKGDDKDVPKVVFIMDTNEFPFYVGERYHQFHDGFNVSAVVFEVLD